MSKIFDCQDRVVTLLNADNFFNGSVDSKPIAVMSQRQGNIQNAVQQNLIKVGVGVIVMLPLITFSENETPDLTLGLRFAVVVTENVVINQSATGTQKPAEAIIEKILQIVHYKPNGVLSYDETHPARFIVDRNAVRVMAPAPGSQALLNYTIAVNTDVNLNQ